MSKQKNTPAPATVLVITLQADGNATLLTRRGELAHLSQFTYLGLQEIVLAIQAGATSLIELEVNPPAIASDPIPPTSTAEIQPNTQTPGEESVETLTYTNPQTDAKALPIAEPANSVFTSKVPQPKLF